MKKSGDLALLPFIGDPNVDSKGCGVGRCSEVLKGLGRSGSTVAFISTYARQNPTSWCRIMARNPKPGDHIPLPLIPRPGRSKEGACDLQICAKDLRCEFVFTGPAR